MLFPKINVYKDGGTQEYSALLYKVIVWKELSTTLPNEYRTGTEIHFFPFNLKSINYYKEKFKPKYESYSYRGYFFNYRLMEKVTNKDQIIDIFNRIHNLSDTVISKFNSYTDEYFNDKDLIVVYLASGGSVMTMELENILFNDNIEITIKHNLPEYDTDNLSGYIFFIEVDKSDKKIKVFMNTNDQKKEIKYCEISKTYQVLWVNPDNMCPTLKLYSQNEKKEYTTSLCNINNINFKKENFYKFTFGMYLTEVKDNIDNLFKMQPLIKVDQVDKIINEEICY